jgi:hypothetical protein
VNSAVADLLEPMIHALPFLTLPDPETETEGAIDPLGLSAIGDRLADEILPGLRARMSRPRFLTAIAVAARVCEGLEDEIAGDHVTPAYLVFEWLLVEGFVRAGDSQSTVGTPGTLKAQAVKNSGQPMCARTYLRVPSIFGFHGVYKPLARHLGIVDDDFRLGDNGYALLKAWQTERRLDGFLSSSMSSGEGMKIRELLRSAIKDGLREACTRRSASWQGWTLLAQHLAPSLIGQDEAACTYKLLNDLRGGPRREVFRLLEDAPDANLPESRLVVQWLLPRASEDLKRRLSAIAAFEDMCALLERAFDWARYLSTKAGARAIDGKDFSNREAAHQISGQLHHAIRQAEDAVDRLATIGVEQNLAALSEGFDRVSTPAELFEAVLARHTRVQKAKKPDGKRDWFEMAPNYKAFVRVPYRLSKEPQVRDWWNRPYRIATARSFWSDLQPRAHGTA